jgi:hypothetical protein
VEERGAEAGLVLLARLARADGAASELCVAGAVPAAVRAATTHRASVGVRAAVADLLEAAVGSGDEDCVMRVAHFATPVIVALARTQDAAMQVRALRMMRTLCVNNFNKFSMQKGFEVPPPHPHAARARARVRVRVRVRGGGVDRVQSPS